MLPYLRSGYLCPVTRETVEYATDIVRDGQSDREKAKTLFEHVRDEYCWDMKGIKGASYLIRKDATYAMSMDKSNLLVSLLRSVEIPARFRLMECTFYNEYKDRVDRSMHAPVEVRLDDEWVVADPAFGVQTERFKDVAEFGEETWEEVISSQTLRQLPRSFVWGYNYLFRWFHPKIWRIRHELRKCQEL